MLVTTQLRVICLNHNLQQEWEHDLAVGACLPACLCFCCCWRLTGCASVRWLPVLWRRWLDEGVVTHALHGWLHCTTGRVIPTHPLFLWHTTASLLFPLLHPQAHYPQHGAIRELAIHVSGAAGEGGRGLWAGRGRSAMLQWLRFPERGLAHVSWCLRMKWIWLHRGAGWGGLRGRTVSCLGSSAWPPPLRPHILNGTRLCILLGPVLRVTQSYCPA